MSNYALREGRKVVHMGLGAVNLHRFLVQEINAFVNYLLNEPEKSTLGTLWIRRCSS
jgi:hypothetical protein